MHVSSELECCSAARERVCSLFILLVPCPVPSKAPRSGALRSAGGVRARVSRLLLVLSLPGAVGVAALRAYTV